MGRIRGRAQQERRLVKMDPPVSGQGPCDGANGPGVDEEPIRMPLDDQTYVLVVMRSDGPKLVGFAIMLYVEEANQEHEVARIDTAHGEAHLHQFARGGIQLSRTSIVVVRNLQEINASYDEAIGRIVDEYEELTRRWDCGR